MFSEGNRGLYDRFRGRIIWPIRTVAGETIGFGARRLFDDDQGPKYLNTPETPLYKKSQVLYGIDLAKREMTKTKQVVIVEGYTDVMAAHLAGIKTAVATCGTAFGAGHIKVVRRMITDDGSGGEIIFTFDGDAAGQKAALAAFEEDQRFVAQTYVAVAQEGMDPCDLRLHRGDAAVRSLIASRRPLFEFVIDTTLKRFDLTTLEGRVLAMRAIAPIIAGIRDRDLRPAYMRKVSGQLGMELEEIQRAVAYAQRHPQQKKRYEPVAQQPQTPRYEQVPGYGQQVPQNYSAQPWNASAGNPAPQPEGSANPGNTMSPTHSDTSVANTAGGEPILAPDPADPVARLEKAALEIALQHPHLMSVSQWQEFARVEFRYRMHREISRGIIHAASTVAPAAGVEWLNVVRSGTIAEVHPAIAELSVAALPIAHEEHLPRFIEGTLNSLFIHQITRQKSDLMMRLEQLSSASDSEEYAHVQRELLELEMRRRTLTKN